MDAEDSRKCSGSSRALDALFDATADDIFLVKLSYWIGL